ncbi:triose-phosphate isomerase [Acetobacteraceae bacterium]|nr:triose-phosphate isomerase [Acetobacteraceae bacterium]
MPASVHTALPPHYIIGNWKMNGTRHEAEKVTKKIIHEIKEIYTENLSPIICPPFTLLDRIGAFLAKQEDGKYHFPLGAQNCSYPTTEPRTGSVSAEMLADLGVSFVILGHSERRKHNRETCAEILKKALAVQAVGLKPIICIGENAQTRDQGETISFLRKQIEDSVPDHFSGFLSYEPIWAIGQANSAPVSAIEEAAKNIKNILIKKNPEAAPVVFYGGSVNAKNVSNILALREINGVLLGRASLDAESFLEVYRKAVTAVALKQEDLT